MKKWHTLRYIILAINRGKFFKNQDDILMFDHKALDMLKVRILGELYDFIL